MLIITYFYSVSGCCPAEWADDKVDALAKQYKKVVLITSLSSRKSTAPNVKHFRVPSLSLIDVRLEIDDIKADNRKVPYIKLFFLIPFILTIGIGLDFSQKILTSGNGGGKWSWTFPAFICALFLSIRYKCRLIFTTGGPSSAHLAGVLAAILIRGKLICELQDPMTGEGIGRNLRSAVLLEWSEKIIFMFAHKVVYVTKSAAEFAKKKYHNTKAEIVAIYPGSRVFSSPKIEKSHDNNKISMIHLGTLYSTRNLYTLIQAIDELIEEGRINSEQIQILNLGEVYGEIKQHHLSKPYFKQESIKPRQEAIQVASSYKILLLVQHLDPRSETTIPYKTYDYINIGNPIFALTKSQELSKMLSENGHVSVDISNIFEIKILLLDILNNYNDYKSKVKPIAIDISEQIKKLLEL